MSMPSFPVVDPPIDREDAVNQILSSIAMEELGLSHILNAEGEKLQYILGTLPGLSGPPATVSDVLAANESVRDLLEAAVQNQLFLRAKMQGALEASQMQGATGPTGPTGATGPAGGPTGPAGPTGPTGVNVTATSSFAANTSGSVLAVVLAGVLVPLPDAQVLPADITVNGANTVFTVNTAGRYRLSYEVNTTASLASGTTLLINGTANTASTIAPLVSLSHFSNEVMLNLAAGTTVSLQMFGIASAATLLPGSAGASLMITRLS